MIEEPLNDPVRQQERIAGMARQAIDMFLRKAVQFAWTALPESKRTPDQVEQIIQDALEGALKDMRREHALTSQETDSGPGTGLSPMAAGTFLRQAVQSIWASLPDSEQVPDEIERIFRERLEAALHDMQQDPAGFCGTEINQDAMNAETGFGAIDVWLRLAIQVVWMSLPESRRTPDEVTRIVRAVSEGLDIRRSLGLWGK